MTDSPAFLSIEHVLAIHQRVIYEFGGDAAVRDHGLLASAVAMPAAQFAGRLLHEDIPVMAAAYLFHLCKNHPFVDGNKRVAVTAAEVFLLLNDRYLSATNEQLEEVIFGVATGQVSKEEVIGFFRRHVAAGDV